MTDTLVEWRLIKQIRAKHNHTLILHGTLLCAEKK